MVGPQVRRCRQCGILNHVSTARRLHYSYDDYLRALEVSALKLEYCDGAIYAMAGGSATHAELAARIIRLLGNALGGHCRVYTSDLKVRVEAADLGTFPDAAVVCGDPIAPPIDNNAVTNPTLLVEVTSRSTEDYDRGDKLSSYKQLPTLRAVLLVSHRRRQVTVVARSDSGWEEREYRGGEVILVAMPQVGIDVDDLYEGVRLEEN